MYACYERNLKQTLEISDNASDPKVKLQAVAIANDYYKFILDMSTNARNSIRRIKVCYPEDRAANYTAAEDRR